DQGVLHGFGRRRLRQRGVRQDSQGGRGRQLNADRYRRIRRHLAVGLRLVLAYRSEDRGPFRRGERKRRGRVGSAQAGRRRCLGGRRRRGGNQGHGGEQKHGRGQGLGAGSPVRNRHGSPTLSRRLVP